MLIQLLKVSQQLQFNMLLALNKYPIEKEVVLILITSLMVWNKTPPNLKELKDPNQPEPNEEGENPENPDEPKEEPVVDIEEDEKRDHEGEEIDPNLAIEEIKKPEPPQKQYIQIPYKEEDY